MTDSREHPHELPIDGTLDLHLFQPKDVKNIVLDYIDSCLEKKIFALRIIHGKGIGVQRELVHSILRDHPSVISFRHDETAGGWGATVVDLKRPTATF